ncbi:MAG: DegT/DnrJ/EryC1/StrS family aminotransferase [Candidatus Omnitrophica bacterium]|nr:DegT/DnrJ/EryC1/StrS family aminotransferase [Candidatus Omnitrophota bacterium]MDD5099099.1 DegT/DnrJ/EryC1/StrS family aminotransferase [Candidatus Colwellbacteria bacterium]
MRIYFENYGKDNALLFKKTLSNIADVLRLESEYAHENYVRQFEAGFARYNKSSHVIGVNSGTTALQLSLEAIGIKAADEVILPAYTYIASALAVSNTGAKPVFVDITEGTLTIDPEEIKKHITKRTKAIIPVHIHGNPCDMHKICAIAKKYGLSVIEDASHAHGAEYRGKKVGNFGIGCFSCHTTKILSGTGNSGIITTDDNNTYELISQMVQVGNDPYPGLTARTPCKMDAIQAAVLKTKLSSLNTIIKQRRKNASFYVNRIGKYVRLQQQEQGAYQVFRDFVILSPKRDIIATSLKESGIETKIRYKTPLHLTKFYSGLKYKKGDLPVAEKTARQALCLPISSVLSPEELGYVCDELKKAVK